ncbi:MAG TPA: glycosyltransferase family 1 protein [Ktedonobacteraceae bacterium]|jgi:glycosyltransferase involved in cell wall biosynthesis|nr:glycosyltransferase family 1 protein [Ktedonobacteraceae bacterium]
MRVAIITENFLPKLDGVTRTLARLLEHLQQRKHEAILLGPASSIEQYAGAEIVGTAGIPLPFYPELKFNFFRPLFIRRLKEFRPDIVHLIDPVVLGAAGLAAARFLNIPVVSSYHTNLAAYCRHFGFPIFTRPMWIYNRFIHNQCELTFCPSPSTAAMLREQGFEHLRIWPRGVDTTLFSPERRSAATRAGWLQGNKAEKILLLYVGRISWEKNLGLLTRAYRAMDTRHCHLVIIGDGPALKEIQVELAGLPVTFTGYLQGEELARAYASADIFAFPSTSETFGQVVLEAMASGLPVVGVHSEGVCDLVRDGQTGFLSYAPNKDDMVISYQMRLEYLIHSKQARQDMGEAAHLYACSRSWSEAMECLMRGYAEVLTRQYAPAAA